eukprot:3526715-Amphidinium_carterae.1
MHGLDFALLSALLSAFSCSLARFKACTTNVGQPANYSSLTICYASGRQIQRPCHKAGHSFTYVASSSNLPMIWTASISLHSHNIVVVMIVISTATVLLKSQTVNVYINIFPPCVPVLNQ